jgi:hypothetical protein
MFYRFACGKFVEAGNFEDAKLRFLAEITAEKEKAENWTECTCVGFQHRIDCPEHEICF